MIVFSILGRAILHKDAQFEHKDSLSIFYGSIIVLPPCFVATIFASYKYSLDKFVCVQNPVLGVILGLVSLFAVMLLISLVGHYVSFYAPYTAVYIYEEMMLGFVVFFGFWLTVLCVGLFVRDICYSRERPCGRRWFLVRFQALYLCLATTMPCFCHRALPQEDGIDIMDIDFNAWENGMEGGNNNPPVVPAAAEEVVHE